MRCDVDDGHLDVGPGTLGADLGLQARQAAVLLVALVVSEDDVTSVTEN